MTMRDGGTAFEAARNGSLPTFERRLSTKADYELGKSAWNASSRIWGTSKSFLDGAVDDAPTRPSPVREGSQSNYAQAKMKISLPTATDLNDENAPHSKMQWGSVSASVGFPSRQRIQPLSPTQQTQNQVREFLPNSSNGTHGHTSLFAGSDPDVDDLALAYDVQHSQDHRRGLGDGSRVLPSPTRAMTFGSSQLDPHSQAFNLNRVHASGMFATAQDFEREREQRIVNGFQQLNGSLDVLPPLSSPGAFMPTHGLSAEPSYRYNPISPTNGRANGRPMTSEHMGELRPATNQNYYEDTMRSFESMSLDQANAGLTSRQMAIEQSRFQRDASHVPAHLSHPDGRFLLSTGQDQSLGSRLNPQAPPHYGGFQYAMRGSQPSLTNEYRSSLNSPYYSTTGTPPTGPQSIRSTPGSGMSSRTSHHDPFVFDRSFAGVDQYDIDRPMFSPTAGRPPINTGFQYDAQIPSQPMRMNPLAHPYVAHEHDAMHNYPSGPRMPVREPEQAHIIRSPLLEEFRLHSKHNRRYELKDIYGYVVEFSGDQHGSRFIQQKLETANSDEKEQIVKELQPNLLQLMTDVFGNYVIQKIFEHGNQTQKKILANHMKGYVLHLSMQMYGCRVVQKAFEHVLVDQQASLVKELDGPNSQVLKVVKDQNGNHVVQKAIERIPGEHIQFIIDAHRGQMAKMSTHQYGCRVVQRMLEHCQPQVKRIILDELLEHINPLISDAYGNYVVQHIIQNGELRDRRQVVGIILHQLLVFSKHKFASNIVEKSIDCADADQREQILRGLIGPDETGATPVLGLMRDQYGNYVLQKVFNQLQGARLQNLRADMERNYPVLRRTSYGKQAIAIEKLLFGNGGPPVPPPTSAASAGSSRSSNLPSTNPSSSGDSDTPSLHQADAK